MSDRTFTLTIAGNPRVLGADDAPLTAAAVTALDPGEYRWVSDPCITTMDVVLNTSGGRVVFEAAGFGHRALPLPFMAQLRTAWGHADADVVGRIEEIPVDGLRVLGAGWVTVGEGDDDPGRQYALALANRNMRAVSVDVTTTSSTDVYELGPDGQVVDMVTFCHEWAITGLTAVSAGADPEARVMLDMGDDGPAEMPDEMDDESEPEEDDDAEPMAAAAVGDGVAEGTGGERTFSTGLAENLVAGAPRIAAAAREAVLTAEAEARAQPPSGTGALTAATTRPPAEWFDNPHLERVTPLQVDVDGRVYGHLAPWSQPGKQECHVGFADRCVCAPKSPDGEYPYFLTGEVLCADGSKRRCGRVALYGGHHRDDSAPWTQVQALYDDVSNLGALVNVGEDRFGLWAAGMVAPGSTEEDIALLRACGPSGHWQRVAGDPSGARRLIAACAVLSQGFPIASLAASSHDGREVATVGAPVASYDADGPVSLIAATGTASLARAKEPVDRGTVDALTARLEDVEALARRQGDLLDLLGPDLRERATAALG